MLSPATHHIHSRRRFGLTEVLLIAGILVIGAMTLLGDGNHAFESRLPAIENASGS